MRGRVLRGGLLATASTFGSAAVTLQALPRIEVVGVSPVAGSEIDIDRVPSNVLSVGSETFSHTKTPDFFQAMIQGNPFVAPSDQSQFRTNLDYRGFTASRAQEIPQGIAVYRNGVRINEAYGDVVNWTSSRKWPSIA